MQRLASRLLLVEGHDDRVVIEKLLARRKLKFEEFAIHNCEGVNKLLKVLPTAILVGTYEVIGVIVDADEDIDARWRSVKKILVNAGYGDVPAEPVKAGTVIRDEDNDLPKIGVWLMPDNRERGAIEDFIRLLIPNDDPLLPEAETMIHRLIAETLNRFKPIHRSKALIHTWLAWQRRPGLTLGAAVTSRVARHSAHLLDDGKASDFIEWLKRLFG